MSEKFIVYWRRLDTGATGRSAKGFSFSELAHWRNFRGDGDGKLLTLILPIHVAVPDAWLRGGTVTGWPGMYWIERASGGSNSPLCVSKDVYECKGEGLATHGIVRALNWWNELYFSLSKSTTGLFR